jgi:glycerophosphoryl diester phosphodiesterase
LHIIRAVRFHSAITAVVAFAAGAALPAAQSRSRQAIAHRGASGYAPEHTVTAYRLAMVQEADFVEQDLAVTRDEVLICLHDDTLERTSDVATVFPARFSKESIIRAPGKHWIANDFTIAEIRRLDTGRWFSGTFAGERIVTWQEAIDLVRGKAGLYPELKSPALYASRGVDMEALFVDSMKKNGLDRPESLKTTPIVIQSFDEASIRRVAADLPTVPRVLLTSDESDVTEDRIRDLGTFASGIAPEKHVIERHPDMVARAHKAGLTVTSWTFRAGEQTAFPTVRDEMSHFLYELGIDALFTNNPDQFPRR